MHGTNFQDLDETPESVTSTTKALAAKAVHLARLLAGRLGQRCRTQRSAGVSVVPQSAEASGVASQT